jgi:hypothetical protein
MTTSQDFRFSYRHGSSECRLHVKTTDGRTLTSFIVCEPGLPVEFEHNAHMALSVAHSRLDWMAEGHVLAKHLVDEVFSHPAAKHFRPSDEDGLRLHTAVGEWVNAVRKYASSFSFVDASPVSVQKREAGA